MHVKEQELMKDDHPCDEILDEGDDTNLDIPMMLPGGDPIWETGERYITKPLPIELLNRLPIYELDF